MTPNLQQIKTPINADVEILRSPFHAAAPCVLVVEDHDDTRALMKYLMELRDIKVLEEKYDDEALEIAQREFPQLILMDLNLGFTGLKATRRIREDARLRDMPIVAVSAHAGEKYETAARAAGCNEYLTKPFTIEQLNAVLDRFLFFDCRSSEQKSTSYVQM